ncbi:MAG: DUF2207 domain-containing protein [Clostridiaceae bacterium]|nr:DUF2207 domain-containing protein [Clostridiaceae bacterium]
MKTKIIKILSLMTIPILIIFTMTGFGFAESQNGYRISEQEVVVKVINNGDLEITEKVKYSSLGNSNNAVILIDKQEGEEIEIKKVYTQIRDEIIECEQLSEGQWDANVFNGTYSVLQENSLVRLKVYGTFKKQQGTILVRYNVKNSVKRYGDIALFNRNFILEDWNGYAYDIDIEIQLPKFTDIARIKPFLHGVLVGQKRVLDGRRIKYNIPNTVPGEYIETRIAFPENLVKDAPVTDPEDYLETLLNEEKEYSESDKSHLLKARENAAKEAGKKAWNVKMKQRAKIFSAIFSLFASFTGLLTIYRAQKELRRNQDKAAFMLKDIPELTPQEAYLLLTGKTGARGILAGLFGLASKGFIKVEFIKENICFKIIEDQNEEHLNASAKDLLRLIRESRDDAGKINIINYTLKGMSPEEEMKYKENYLKFDENIKADHLKKNKLTPSQLYYRNLGLILGVILFAAGCIVSVAFSVLSAYLMLPVGFLIFWYSLNIERNTPYSINRKKALKKLKEIIINNDNKEILIPNLLSDQYKTIGFSIALGIENKLHLLEDVFEDKDINNIEGTLEKALKALNDTISALLDD